jgi:hypothetical protein
MDVTTLALAVDSSQVTGASSALDRFAQSGSKAEGAAAALTKAANDQGRTIGNVLVPAAGKGAKALKDMGDAQKSITAGSASEFAGIASGLSGVESAASAAAAAVSKVGLSYQQFRRERLAPLRDQFVADGMPLADAQAKAVQQVSDEWKRYKQEWTAAQSAVLAQSGAVTAALSQMAAEAARAEQAVRAAVAGGGSGGDLAQVNELAAAANRAERQVEELGTALGRSLASGASTAKAAITDLSRATTSLGAAAFVDFEKVTTSLGATAAKAGEATNQVNSLRREIELTGPLASAGTSLGATVGPRAPAGSLREALTRNQPDNSELAARLGGGAAAIAAAGGAATRATPQMNGLGNATKLTAYQMQQLSFQANDFFVQIASGQSPLTAAIQQGSQLAGTFDGMGNAFKAITSLITPMRLAIGGTAAAVLGLAYAFNEGEKRSKAFQDAVVLSGNFAGKTEGQFNQLARSVADSTDASVLKVRELGQALLATGEIGPQVFDKAMQAGVGFGEATKQTADQVAKDFARIAREPAKAFVELNRQLNFPNASKLYDLIKGLEDTGETGKAAAVVFDALNERFPKLQQNITTVDDALSKAQRSFARFWESAFAPTTVEDRIKSLTDRVNQLRAAASGGTGVTENAGGAAFVGPRGVGASNALANAETELADLQRRQFRQSEIAAGNALQAQVNKEAVAAKESIDQWAKRGKAASLYKEEVDKLKRGFEANERAGTPVPKDVQAAALEGVRKAFATPGSHGGQNEAQQVLDAQLDQKVKAARDALAEERDQMAFSQRVLQESYRQGTVSLKEFYEGKRQAIADGVAAEIAELEKERADVQEHMDATRKTSPKDTSALVKDQTRLNEIAAQQEKLRRQGSRETVLANLEETSSFKQLNDQLLNYQANLKALQGDEVGALRIRGQLSLEQARLLDRQARVQAPKTTGDFARMDRGQVSPGENEQAQARINAQQEGLTEAKTRTSQINQQLQIQEERIATAQSTGAITTLESLRQVTEVRTRAVRQLEEQVQTMDKLLEKEKENAELEGRPINLQLVLDTSRAHMELEKLRGEVDVLANQFRQMFTDAGSNFFNDLMSGKGLKGALKGFGDAVSREINGVVSRQLSEQLFGKGGAFKDAGGFLAKIFGSKDGKDGQAKTAAEALKAQDPTQSVQTSLSNLQTTGIEPTTQALGRLADAANNAASSMGQKDTSSPYYTQTTQADGSIALSRTPVAGVTADQPADSNSYHDYGTDSGEQSVMGMFKDAERSSQDYAKSNAAAGNAVLQLANAASKGGGALGMLPAIINAIQMASASGSSSGGGGIGSVLGSLGSSGSSSSSSGYSFTQNGGYTPSADYSYLEYGYSDGGYTGDMDPKKVAGVVHGKEVVFSAAAVRTIGKDVLLDAQQKAAKGQRPALFADPGEYQGSGIVQRAAASMPNLKANEVPAVLMGGPKGTREEVLTADDPRHRDNLKPEVASAIFANAPRYHTGGIVGRDPDRPDMLVARDRRYLTKEPATEAAGAERQAGKGGETHIHVTVMQPPGGSRETAMQWGRTAGRAIDVSRNRNGR